MADYRMPAEGGKYEVKGTPESPVVCPGTGAVNVQGQVSNLRVGLALLKNLSDALHADVLATFRTAAEAAKGGPSEELNLARRNAARALFAYIEGTVYAMKQTALRMDEILAPQRGSVFTPEEMSKLREKRVNKRGVEKRLYLPAAENLTFAFDAFTRRHPGYTLKDHGDEWETYPRGLEIRHRLTHPKAVEELVVSDAEFSDVLFKTGAWFRRVFGEVAQHVHDRAKDGPVVLLRG